MLKEDGYPRESSSTFYCCKNHMMKFKLMLVVKLCCSINFIEANKVVYNNILKQYL